MITYCDIKYFMARHMNETMMRLNQRFFSLIYLFNDLMPSDLVEEKKKYNNHMDLSQLNNLLTNSSHNDVYHADIKINK